MQNISNQWETEKNFTKSVGNFFRKGYMARFLIEYIVWLYEVNSEKYHKKIIEISTNTEVYHKKLIYF